MNTVLNKIAHCKDDTDKLDYIAKNFLPSGSGIDSGTQIALISDEKVELFAGYHYMNDFGMYAGWFEFKIICKASLRYGVDYEFEICSNNTDLEDEEITELFEDYLIETYMYQLSREVCNTLDPKTKELTLKYVGE